MLMMTMMKDYASFEGDAPTAVDDDNETRGGWMLLLQVLFLVQFVQLPYHGQSFLCCFGDC